MKGLIDIRESILLIQLYPKMYYVYFIVVFVCLKHGEEKL